MENLELREALQRYVRSDEPPVPFTAGSLIAQGRGRQRRRIALGLVGGGAATTLAVLSGMMLVPGMSGGGDLFADQKCRWTLPIGTYRLPTPQPTPSTDIELTPTESIPLMTPPPLAESPSLQVTPDVTPEPTIMASRIAVSTADVSPPASPAPASMPGQVDEERLRTMSCFLKKEMLELLPNRNHVPPSEPPLEPMANVVPESSKGWRTEYYARTSVVDGGRLCFFDVRVQPIAWAVEPNRAIPMTTPGGKRAHVVTTSADYPWVAVFVRTADSYLTLSAEGGLISLEQLLALADAPELDLYR